MISLLVPTRGRPYNMRRFVATALAAADDPSELEAVFYIDEDDLESFKAAADMRHDGYPVQWICGPRIVLSQCWNECFEVAEGPYYGHMGDDIAFRTSGWDTLILDGFRQWPDNIAFVHGRDGLQAASRLATHGFLHDDWVRASDWFCPPYFSSDMNDVWLTEVADLIGRRVTLPHVFTEHMHPDAGKGDFDDTHRERVERGKRDNVMELYRKLLPERMAHAEVLRKVIANAAG